MTGFAVALLEFTLWCASIGIRPMAQGSYNRHQYLGTFRHLMIGMSNNYHLFHDSRGFDRAMKLFRRQTLREMTCFMQLCTAEMLSEYNQTLSPLALGKIKLVPIKQI